MTLAELRTAAQQRADQENSDFVSESEWNSYINQSYYELYDLLVQKYGDDYFVSTDSSIVTDGSNDRFSIASISPAVYKLLGVDLQLSGTAGAANGSYIQLRPFNFSERSVMGPGSGQLALARSNLRYRLNGSTLWLTPLPASGQTIRLWYVPQLTSLTSDSSSADGVSGWLEYVICDAAIKAMQKEESDVSVLFAQKQALVARIESAAENRDAGSPSTVADVAGRYSWGINGEYWG
jgi:hypothetical protein